MLFLTEILIINVENVELFLVLALQIMQKLQAKYDKLFEKIVFAQREDKDDIAYSHACEIVVVRKMMKMDKHELIKIVLNTDHVES